MSELQKICKIKLTDIPKEERSQIEKELFYPWDKILDGGYLEIDLRTIWTQDSSGNEVPTYSFVLTGDSVSSSPDLELGIFGEYFIKKYQAILSILEDERLASEHITFFEGFEKEDIKRLAYVSMQIYGSEHFLNREHCDFLYKTLDDLGYVDIALSEEEKKTITMDIPPEYFEDGRVPLVQDSEEEPYISINTFKYLVSKGVLKEGSLSLEDRNELTNEEKNYIKWLSRETDIKPKIETKINEESLFADLFDDDSSNVCIKF